MELHALAQREGPHGLAVVDLPAFGQITDELVRSTLVGHDAREAVLEEQTAQADAAALDDALR